MQSYVCPVKTDWTMVLNCKQGRVESPSDYFAKRKDVFERYWGIACPTETVVGTALAGIVTEC